MTLPGGRKLTYSLHRWVGLVVSLQLLAWSVGGLYFSWFPMDTIRGTADARSDGALPIAVERVAVTPAAALARYAAAGEGAESTPAGAVTEVLLRSDRHGAPLWELRHEAEVVALVDASTGAVRPLLDRAAAESAALADFAHPATVTSSELLTANPPLEIRGRQLPVWRVTLDHPRRPNLYVDARTGEVVARRNDLWRVFDFLWMLHIMDYSERENFHHPLLTTMSALAVLSSLSGVALWGWRAASRLRGWRASG